MMRELEAITPFNRGAQARLDGVPLEACPHERMHSREAYVEWRQGWVHVSRYWAIDARRRGYVARPLPPVRAAS